jgi:K+-sensing histidine kinase KdpD
VAKEVWMSFFSPRIAPGIGTAMARVGARFYFFSILLVVCTIYLPHPISAGATGLIILALLTMGTMILLHLIPWDTFEPRVFTLAYTLSSSALVALLVFFTGGLRSSYDLLFFLVILFAYFYNLVEMLAITTVVTLFYLLPYFYGLPQRYHYAASTVTVLLFYLGTYVLHGVTRFMLKKNQALEELNTDISELYSFTAGLLKDMEKDALVESLSEKLKDHLPSTYCIVMLLDDKFNLTTRIACPIRALTWEPAIGTIYTPDRLSDIRKVLETRQPKLIRLAVDEIDEDLRKIITKSTQSLLIVPIRIAAENVGVIIFGEERQWNRAPFTNEKIQLAVAISRQIGIALNMRWCYERLIEARHSLHVSQDKVLKAERLATLGEVTRAVEHEINNPLNVIVNWAEIYREDGAIDPELRRKFQIIYDMAMRITAVIKKLAEIKDAKSIEFIKGQKMMDIE